MKARELLSWNVHDLAHQTNLPPNVIADFERGKHQLQRHQNINIKEAFESQGVIFGENMAVSLKKKRNAATERLRHIDKANSAKTTAEQTLEKLLAKTNNPPKL